MSSLSSLQIHQTNEWGLTTLMLACDVGADRRIIEMLIDAGSEMEARDSHLGFTALHHAAYWQQLEAVEVLLSRGSEINGKSDNGWTPLHFAANATPEWTDGVKELMKHSAVEVNPRNEDGQTPLHWACDRGYLHTVELLLGHNGIDANVVNNKGDTPLHVAVQRQRYNIVSKMLIQFGEELKLGNEERCSGVVVASYLAHHGANFYCKNKIGRTPLDLIEKENFKKTLKTLFRPTQCVFCEDEVATETFFPCKHLSLCKKCCPQKIPKRCPTCGQKITSKNSLVGPNSSNMEVQMVAGPVGEYEITVPNYVIP
ncbi:E3 ubiquitin-protein ligase MIB2-like isoform X2 [Octopus vulgaris]|uniref:E3 ubiquitin-protein ligase MIB2-like isoform X2 n=1 Tax=Octopus vulgaris TaxID=6645 RepID=A0AA36MFJ9_OCTVU|nr:E3 ubiquitin-protein ligase MIB2-like isoform X2 [Octopus vulgaris]